MSSERAASTQESQLPGRVPLHESFREITEHVIDVMQRKPGRGYWLLLLLSLVMMTLGLAAWGTQIIHGLGMTGLMHPMMWAIYIGDYIWWIGIATAGTLTSAILFLFRAPFRAAFSRAAEGMTCIAILTAGLFPLIHLGRTWRFYWVFPYPNERHLWVNFRSPLIIDVWVIATYLVLSIVYFWLELLPDAAVVRDRSTGWKRTIYGMISLGWEGTDRQWKHLLMASTLHAALLTPVIISMHSITSWDLALAIVPDWHYTIFPPYFVTGAIFSGLAMLLTLMIPIRSYFHLERVITVDRLEQLAKIIIATSLMVTYSYAVIYFMAWYRGDPIEEVGYLYQFFGGFKVLFWLFTICNCVFPLTLLFRRLRRNLVWLWILSIIINVGMLAERWCIVAAPLARDYDVYSWAPGTFHVSWVGIGITIGSLGFFLFSFLIFIKVVPIVPLYELRKDMLREAREARAETEAEGLLKARYEELRIKAIETQSGAGGSES
ncbi:MAG TPA: NrfD/PsrC family molybdoenzyme membrane anchor subunit [Armatimonadota bacterium]|nr:NrfD/PsrC family molybdoenzyme membrane anchor subunit [Armatimonadota bacterium]